MTTKTPPATTGPKITFRGCATCGRTTTQQLTADRAAWYCRLCSSRSDQC